MTTNNAINNIQNLENFIPSGDFTLNPWQRGTSFTSIADDTYCADRWYYTQTGSQVLDASRSTDVPSLSESGILSQYSLLLDVTTANASIGSGQYSLISTFIEGYDFTRFAQNEFILTFWVKATKTGIYCVSFSNSAVDRTYIAEYTINTTDTWEFKAVRVAATPSGGAWNYATGIGLSVRFALAAGSNFQNTADTWLSANDYATSNQVNGLDSTSNNFRLALVQLTRGHIIAPFLINRFGNVLTHCQRYFEKTFNIGVAPAQGTGNYAGALRCPGTTSSQSALMTGANWCFKVNKRQAPQLIFYNTRSGTSNNLWEASSGAGADISANTSGYQGTNGIYVSTGATSTASNYYSIHVTADADF